MTTEWKPGDVGLIPFSSHEERAIWTNDGWVATGYPTVAIKNYINVRPLVVIDPEDREQAARLIALFSDQFTSWSTDGERDADKMLAALREFANPKPPKPEEPTGLGAVVEDADGELYVFTDPTFKRGWTRSGTGNRVQWGDIAAARVLSEGV